MSLPASALLVGPGWLGAPLGEALARRGVRVIALRRSDTPPPTGCEALHADVGAPETAREVAELLANRGATPRGAVIAAVAPSRARGDDYAIYPAAAAGCVALARAAGARTLLWVSSTGVYAKDDGDVVTETTPVASMRDARLDALITAEAQVMEAHGADLQAIVLRPAGLYGLGRDPAARFRGGDVTSESWCNFSWRDDVIAAAIHLLERAHLVSSPDAAVYNCTDDTPVRAGAITAALLGRMAPTERSPDVGATSPRGASGRSNQRVSSAALRATGWTPAVPSVFDGLRLLGHRLPGLEGSA